MVYAYSLVRSFFSVGDRLPPTQTMEATVTILSILLVHELLVSSLLSTTFFFIGRRRD